MTEPDLSQYVLVIEDAHRAYIRHSYKHTSVCNHRTNVASISGEPLSIPTSSLIQRCAKHDAECPWLCADRELAARMDFRSKRVEPADDLGPFLQPDYIAAPVNDGPVTMMRCEGGVKP